MKLFSHWADQLAICNQICKWTVHGEISLI